MLGGNYDETATVEFNLITAVTDTQTVIHPHHGFSWKLLQTSKIPPPQARNAYCLKPANKVKRNID